MGPRIDVINAWLDATMDEVKGRLARLPDEQKQDWQELNRLFLTLLQKIWQE